MKTDIKISPWPWYALDLSLLMKTDETDIDLDMNLIDPFMKKDQIQ